MLEAKTGSQTIYQIKVQGRLKEKWAEWLNGMVLEISNQERDPVETTITVAVPDQAALRGIMNKLWDLNSTITLMKFVSR